MSSFIQDRNLVVGKRLEITFELRDVDNELGSASTIGFRYAPPGGSPVSLTPELVSSGIYRVTFLLDRPGTWRYAIDTTDGIDAAFDRSFQVPARILP